MNTIVITGWRPGMEKVSLTMFLRTVLDLSLSDSARITLAVLDGQEQLLHLPSHISVEDAAAYLNEIGVITE